MDEIKKNESVPSVEPVSGSPVNGEIVVEEKGVKLAKRDELGRLQAGHHLGRKKLTDEQRVMNKLRQKAIEEYKEKLTEALPDLAESLLLVAKTGEVSAHKEINDRLMGKAQQNIEVHADVQITELTTEEKLKLMELL